MAATDSSETQLLTEHFGYPPVSLLDDIINSVNSLAARVLDGLEQSLLSTPPERIGFGSSSKSKNAKTATSTTTLPPPPTYPETTPEQALQAEVENGTHQLETLLCASIDRNFDKFELYVMRNILCVKPDDVQDYMRLAHYQGLTFDEHLADDDDDDDVRDQGNRSASSKPTKPSPESVNLLRRKLQASQRLNLRLHEERAKNDALLRELRGLVGKDTNAPGVKTDPDTAMEGTEQEESEAHKAPFAFLHQKGDALSSGDAETPLTTTTAFTLSQLQSLRALSTSLRKVLPDLKADPQHDGDGDDGGDGARAGGRSSSWRKDRVGYVEGATRRHFEQVRGLELGENGEVRDGEWQGKGKRVGKGELEDLESVAALLEQARKDTSQGQDHENHGEA